MGWDGKVETERTLVNKKGGVVKHTLFGNCKLNIPNYRFSRPDFSNLWGCQPGLIYISFTSFFMPIILSGTRVRAENFVTHCINDTPNCVVCNSHSHLAHAPARRGTNYLEAVSGCFLPPHTCHVAAGGQAVQRREPVLEHGQVSTYLGELAVWAFTCFQYFRNHRNNVLNFTAGGIVFQLLALLLESISPVFQGSQGVGITLGYLVIRGFKWTAQVSAWVAQVCQSS